MAFKIRRGTNAERLTITPAQGELIFTTDTKKLYVGDGSTVGGVAVIEGLATTGYVDSAINGLVDGATATLNTLKELADALGSDPNFASNLTNTLAGKADLTYVQTIDTNKADIASLSTVATSGDYNDLLNTPTIPSVTGLASETYVNNKVADLVNSAPTTLDTLKELADALNNDQNFATTVSNSLANKANVSDLANVATSGDYNDLTNQPSIPDLGAVAQDIIPDTDVTYDLGSPTNRFKDLYLSNNTLYLGDDAISVDGVYGLSLKQPGGGEGYGAGSVAWTDQSTLVFSGVEVAHPLYGYLEKLTKGDKIKELAPGDADFTITVTGSLQFGPNVGGFVNVTVPVDQPKSQNNVGSNYYVYVVEFIKPVNNFNNLENSPLVENSNGWYDIDPTANKSIGLQNIVGDGTIYVRPSWDRTPTVDFQFKENGQLQLPAGGDIVDSAGVSVLGGGGPANTGNITFSDNTIGSTANIVDISVSDYAQLNSNDSFVWVDNAGAHVEVNGGEGGREFIFNSDTRSLRAQLQMPQGAKINFGADATALGAPDSSGSTDKIRLWDFEGGNPSGYNYAIGAEGGGIWFSTDVNNGTGGFSFYSQNNRKFKIRDDGTVDLYNHILPDDNNIIDLGSENTKFRNVYAAGVTQSHKRATSCPVNVDTVVYTATGQYQHAIKLFAMVEGNVDGEGSNWHTQACDIIAVRSYNNNTVFVTTYGVTYTSTAAFATFDGQWNATTNRIEITCRPVSTNNNVVVSIHATEITSQD